MRFPGERYPWSSLLVIHVCRWRAVHRTTQARDALLPVADKFPNNWLIPYNLACYAAQLGRIPEAETWFKRAMEIEAVAVKLAILETHDLDPMWAVTGAKKPIRSS